MFVVLLVNISELASNLMPGKTGTHFLHSANPNDIAHIPHRRIADLENIEYSRRINPETRYETQRINHLGIVARICQEIGLIAEIDRQVGPSAQKVSVGQGVQAMVLNALGFSSRALYLLPDYLHNKPADVLIGAGPVAEDFNDYSLGPSLEALYARGVTNYA